MKWVEPEFSKERVKKAGIHLISMDSDSIEFESAIPVFFNWRAAHAFPMQIMLDLLRKNTIKVDKNAFVVQRLKRVPSIFNKLVREESMSLSRMEDIAGCRAVLGDVRQVRRVYSLLKRSRTKNVLYRERDYISNPKDSGYRGIHLVFKYNGSKDVYKGMAVELQIRSKIQHSWATAVEVVGTFTKQALKSSSGEDIWLDFFKYVSVEFAKIEHSPIDNRYNQINTFEKMDECIKILDLRHRLKAFKVATQALTHNKEKGAGYFIILLDLDQKTVKYTRFDKSQLAEATSYYDLQEKNHKGDETKDIVMVSAGSVRDLKRAYPNYFSDTDDFEKYINQIYISNGQSILS